jgi:hypothetical protein
MSNLRFGAHLRRPSRLLFLESVADAVQGLDHFKIRLDHLELFAQPLDVALDGAVVDIHLIVVSRIHQSVAALDYARPGRQRLQNMAGAIKPLIERFDAALREAGLIAIGGHIVDHPRFNRRC